MIHFLLNLLNQKKNFKYFFLSPLPYAIGTASEQIYVAAEYAHKRGKILKILKLRSFNYEICNNSLFENLIVNKEKVSLDNLFWKLVIFILEIEVFFKRIIVLINDHIYNFSLNEYFRFSSIGIQQLFKNKNILKKKYNDIKKYNFSNLSIDISDEEKENCKDILKKINFDYKKKFVCIHVRDHKFRNDKQKKFYRNSNINNYKKSILFLIKKGYSVVRLGSKKMNRFNLKNKNFFDYAFSKIKSGSMDLFLIKHCQFFIGTQSGILDVAYMFKKPVFLTNMCELYACPPLKEKDMGIFKSIYNVKTKKKVSLEKYSRLPFKFHNPDNDIKEYFFKENSEDQILRTVKIFLKNLYSKKKTISNYENKFKDQIKKNFQILFEKKNDDQNNLRKFRDCIRYVRKVKTFGGFICFS